MSGLRVGPIGDIYYTDASSNARPVQDKLRDFVNVKDFGAVGDGSTDDTTAFANAIAAGKEIYIPAGTFVVSSAHFKQCVRGAGTEKSIIKGKTGATGFIVGLTSQTNIQFGNTISDLQIMCNGASQSGLVVYDSVGKIQTLRITSCQATGLQFGYTTTGQGAYWCCADNVRIDMTNGTGTGVIFAGVTDQTLNANANCCDNVYVSGSFVRGVDFGGIGNRWNGGTVEWQAACVDVMRFKGSNNIVDGAYVESVAGAQPTTLFNFTGSGNKVRDLHLQASISNNLYSKIADSGWGNEVHARKNLRFVSVRSQSSKNLWPNSRFKLWVSATQPFGFTNIGAGASKDTGTTFMGNPSLKLTIAGTFLQANCTLLPSGNSVTNYPLEAVQGKTVSVAVACKTTLAGYGGVAYTITAPSGNVNGSFNASHTGGGGWEIFSDSFRIPDDATQLIVSLRSHGTFNTTGTGDVWFGCPTLTIGPEALDPRNVLTMDDEIYWTADREYKRDGVTETNSAFPIIHGRFLWSDNLGALRQSGTRPTDMEADGNPLGRKVAVPATATTAGVPGDWAADTSFYYAYTGDGTTHTWRRVAVGSW